MLVSYNWLQTYFKEKLPEPEKLADIITMGVFEIEAVEKRTKTADSIDGSIEDTVLDVKVLPDRAAYCLSHRYIAQEIGALLGYEYVVPEVEEFDVEETEYVFNVSIEENKSIDNVSTTGDAVGDTEGEIAPLAERYVTRVIENVTVASSPDWLKNKLEVLGQRSINAIVDLTNYFMMETGQPLHVFDADKVKGDVVIRRARVGETVTTLDNKVIQLDASIMVIADDEGPLDIAGIKGGKKAELDTNTKRVMTSAACFNPVLVRKAAQKTGVRTDASKRFENAITPERAGLAESLLTSYIKKLDSSVRVGQVIDIYPNPQPQKNISVWLQDIVERLGTAIDSKTIEQILTRCGFVVDASDAENLETKDTEPKTDVEFLIAIPPYRRDITITEDIIDDIGRIYGYDKVKGVTPSSESDRVILKNYYYHNVIRKTLADIGFSEVYTYSLTDEGTMEVQNPLTSERSRMRDSISYGFSKKFLSNIKNADLLGLKEIRMFEIGKVFGMNFGVQDEKSPAGFCEKHTVAFGIARSKQPKGHDPKTELSAIAHYIIETVGASSVPEMRFIELNGDAQTPCSGYVVEFDIDGLIDSQTETSSDADMGTYCESAHLVGNEGSEKPSLRFKPISQYPFSARDIAVFVPGERHADADVLNVIVGSLNDEQKKLLVKTTLFDVFTKRKEGEPVKTSYAYRLVFQSTERTLTEEEVSGAMKSITDVLAAQVGWEVR
ncbi:MAG: phenylalanine--tRNA ligase subunit beta [Candidatus Pacebacteria bacterium]|nr:phenylalanine--tRNA ligase subunit beta [Candidatus Paceibacterota bacterium]